MPTESALQRRLVLSLAPASSYVPHARVILGRLGYAVVLEADWRREPRLAPLTPELVVVDHEGWEALESDRALRRLPRILIQDDGQAPPATAGGAEAGLAGVVPAPAGLHELYRLLQQALEPTPRLRLRLPTELAARVRRGPEEWPAVLHSLSENGCLLASQEPLELGAELWLHFELPGGPAVETLAEAAYRAGSATGLVFARTPAAARRAIARYVEGRLLPEPAPGRVSA